MKKIIFWINYVDVHKAELLSDRELMLHNIPGKVFNSRFIGSIMFFMSCMLLKANVDDAWAAIPLGFSAWILFSGVWNISGNGKVVFDKNDQILYRVYKHLGYMQIIYTTPLSSVIKAETTQKESRINLILTLDNLETITISTLPSEKLKDAEEIAGMINRFIDS